MLIQRGIKVLLFISGLFLFLPRRHIPPTLFLSSNRFLTHNVKLRYLFVLNIVILTLAFMTETAQSRTWYIKPDGSGDAPTIRAGVDSSAAGDTVLVAAGRYEFDDEAAALLKPEIVVMSEEGPLSTKLIGIDSVWPTVAFSGLGIPYLFISTEVAGFWFDGFDVGIVLGGCENVHIYKNIFTNNKIGMRINLGGYVTITNNTFYGNSEYGIDAYNAGDGEAWWNIFWDRISTGGLISIGNDFLNLSDAGSCCIDANFSQDPEFCGALGWNFFLQSDSPCAPANPPFETYLIGALPVGCGTVDVEAKTWGEIKAIYGE